MNTPTYLGKLELFDGLRNRETLDQRIFPMERRRMGQPAAQSCTSILTECLPVAKSRSFKLVYDAEAIFSDRIRQKIGAWMAPSPRLLLLDEIALAQSADTVVVVSDKRQQDNAPIRRALGARDRISALTLSHFDRIRRAPAHSCLSGACTAPTIRTPTPFDTSVVKCGRACSRRRTQPSSSPGYGTDESAGRPRAVPRSASSERRRTCGHSTRRHASSWCPPAMPQACPSKLTRLQRSVCRWWFRTSSQRQINWRDGIDYLVGADAERFAEQCIRLYGDEALWEELRANALQRVIDELSPEAFEDSVRSVLNEVVPTVIPREFNTSD